MDGHLVDSQEVLLMAFVGTHGNNTIKFTTSVNYWFFV
jgi:hypothetical protein